MRHLYLWVKNWRFLTIMIVVWGSVYPHESSANTTIYRSLDEILQSPTRPTISEVKAFLAAVPGGKSAVQKQLAKEIQSYDANINQIIERWNQHVPLIIAQLERAFPGARWFALGRDAVVMSDILDAFYQSIGQHGRAGRINASGSSFTKDPAITTDFMLTNGFNPATIDDEAPFIMMDGTTFNDFGYSSQSRLLMQAGYHAYAALGKDPRNLLAKFNFINLNHDPAFYHPSYYPNYLRSSRHEDILSEQAQTIVDRTPTKIPTIDTKGLFMSFTWHERFTTMQRITPGTVVTLPGRLEDKSARLYILAQLIELIDTVSKPEFLHNVIKEAKNLGYEFPLKPLYNKVCN